MDIVIITGMSGAGKSTTLDIFEDMGYYAIDNLPPALIIKIAELSRDSHKAIEKLAVVVDIRGGKFFDDLIKAVIDLKDSGENVSLLYLDSKDEILVRRYKELRRPHPLSKSGNTLIGIAKEREALKDIREMVDNFIDTTGLTIGELKSRVMALYGQNE
ncbi:MAG: RNase adaptor protein RapZ, partial [Tissierellia bacterium]|nr:RNase adaptor protein RapZ [Tissierellia bacterium]